MTGPMPQQLYPKTSAEAYDLAMHLIGRHGDAGAVSRIAQHNAEAHWNDHKHERPSDHDLTARNYVPERVEAVLEEAEAAEGIPGTRCPDGGKCHHLCRLACFRVLLCGPLSGTYPDDRWPESVKARHRIGGLREDGFELYYYPDFPKQVAWAVQLHASNPKDIQYRLSWEGISSHWDDEPPRLSFGGKLGSYSVPFGWWVMIRAEGAEAMPDDKFRREMKKVPLCPQ